MEVKPAAEMRAQHVPGLITTYSPIALGASCKVLIFTDSKRSIWVNALTGKGLPLMRMASP